MIRSTQFCCVAVTATGGQVVYTVPAGHRALVKWASIVSHATAPGQLELAVLPPNFHVGWLLLIPAAVQHQLYTFSGGYAVLNAGDKLFGAVGSVAGGFYHIIAGGVLFDL